LKTFSAGSPKSPLLNELIKILHNQFEDDSESRVLIFLQQREFCTRLSDLLSKYTNFNTSYIIGMQGQEKQNIRDQQATIKDFAEGRTKILCATTVAEEGLDISACNLVIQYNYVTHEIARVQRRGRARAKNAKSILLTCDNQTLEKEEQNKVREELMKAALFEMGKFTESDLKQKVEKLVKELNKKRVERREIEEQKKVQRRELRKGHGYFILCSNCSALIGHSDEMFVASMCQFVLCNSEIWNKVIVKDLPECDKDKKFTKMATPIVGDIFCKNAYSGGNISGYCGAKLGRVIRHRSVYLPNLSLKSVVFRNCEFKGQKEVPQVGERILKKKWKEVTETLFDPEQIPSVILVEMKQIESVPELSGAVYV